MKKNRKTLIITLLAVMTATLLLGPVGCKDENSLIKEERLTKEELLEFIEISDSGLTRDDFSDIDLDDFIKYAWLTRNNLATLNINKILELYKSKIVRNKFDQYKAKEIVCVNSSSEEYELFKKAFFEMISVNEQFIGKAEDFIDMFYYLADNEKMLIDIGQTKNLGKFDYYSYPHGTLGIRIGPSNGENIYREFCYSKNKKYFMLIPSSMDIIKTFCEIYD